MLDIAVLVGLSGLCEIDAMCSAKIRFLAAPACTCLVVSLRHWYDLPLSQSKARLLSAGICSVVQIILAVKLSNLELFWTDMFCFCI